MSTIYNTPVNKAITSTDVNNEINKDFMAVFPDIVRDLTGNGCNVDIPQINEWLSKVLIIILLNSSYNQFLLLPTYISTLLVIAVQCTR